MIQFFGISIDALTTILVIITGAIVAGVLLLALTNRLFFKIGARNLVRRRLQLVLIVFALMLSTTLLACVLTTGDVMSSAVQSVAVYNWGNVDETIEGGQGPLATYRDGAYYRVLEQSKGHSEIGAVGAALRENSLLVADQTSRQVRSGVTGYAVLPGSERGFGGMQDILTKRKLKITDLQPYQIYLNQTAAHLLSAGPGDALYLFSQRWSGQRYVMHIAGVIGNDGIVGDAPALLAPLKTFQDIEGAQDQINIMFVANRGGVSSSDQVTADLQHWIPRDIHVIPVKQQGVTNSIKADEIFSRIFSLFALFALAIGLLLIFLIFVLLAAERRAEMGMARAIGMQRSHLIMMFLFEGSIYDLFSSIIGLCSGLGIGVLLIYFLKPVLARFNFPLNFTLQPHSLIVALCLGIIFTFCSVALASWLVSRMTVAEAMRDLPEPGRASFTLGELGVYGLHLLKQLVSPIESGRSRWRVWRRVVTEQIPEVCIELVRILAVLGFVPFLAGAWLMQFGLAQQQIIPFSLGLTLLLLGTGLLLRSILIKISRLVTPYLSVKRARRGWSWGEVSGVIFVTLVGTALVAYWALPFDVLSVLGLPRFQGGIEVFFIAGVMMVLGAVWVIIANARVLAAPVLVLCSRLVSFYPVVKLALAYPLQRRFRTGLSVVMFSLVVFAMTVMAVITNSMQNSYVDIDTQTGGYDIQATPYFKSLPDLRSSLAQHGINPAAFAQIGVRTTTAVGVIQLSAETPRWSIYPAQVMSGGFLQGYGFHLLARANGYSSDSAVLQALRTHPEDVLIDSSALPYNPNVVGNSPVYDPSSPQASQAGAPSIPPHFDADYTFALSGVYQGDKSFPATPIWLTGIQKSSAKKFNIIGVVDNSDSAHYGLYISDTTYSSSISNSGVSDSLSSIIGSGGAIGPNGLVQEESYYFKVAPGQDKRALAYALGSAYLDNGLETTVLEDAIWQIRGPRILLSDVLLGVVGMTLLLGVAALAITGTRAVVERRQQIGMLRALGCSRPLVQWAFLLESFLVGALGSVVGCVLGLVLARNIFAANFFEQYQTGLAFVIPWQQIELIIGVALLASFLGAILPAWQAGRIAPAEALRYA